MMNDPKKSDLVKVAMRPTNKAGPGTAAESVERRTRAEGNTGQQSTHRTQCRVRVSQALERVRQAAKLRKEERFTALLHHINLDLLRLSFYALKRKAAPGVDGVTWQDYEANLESNLQDLHSRVHRGAYREQPSRRKYILSRTGGSGRWALPQWRTRFSNAQSWQCSTPSTRKTFWVSRTASGRSAASMMAWMR